jgi:hypothetical protein
LKARAEDDLPIDTAIRPCWILRDIRAGRKLLAPSSDDLRFLAERRSMSVDNGQLMLTGIKLGNWQPHLENPRQSISGAATLGGEKCLT